MGDTTPAPDEEPRPAQEGPELSATSLAALDLARAELDLAERFVVIVGDTEDAVDLAPALAEVWPTAHLRLMTKNQPPRERRPDDLRLTPVASVPDIFNALAAGPAPDVIIELGGDRGYAGHGAFGATFLSLRDGGAYLKVDLAGEVAAASADDADDSLWQWLGRSLGDQHQPPRLTGELDKQGLVRTLGEAISGVTIRDGSAVVHKRGEHLMKVNNLLHRPDGEHRVEQTVVRRCGEGSASTIAGEPAHDFEVTSPVWVNDAEAGVRLRDRYLVRELAAREYLGAVCAPRGVVTMGGLFLPESSMQPLVRPWFNRGTQDAGPDYAVFPRVSGPIPTLPGSYYHLDNEFPGHYGHVTTQDLSRLWAWDAAVERDPDVRVLLSPPTGHQEPHDYQLRLLEAFGIERDRVTVLREPARVERLVSATLGLQNHYFASPVCTPVWERIRGALVPEAEGSTPERVFIGRNETRRRCLNGDEVERRFVEAGFTVVHPETLDIAEQIRVFSGARAVAGYAGSSMFTMAYATGDTHWIVIGSRSYTATTEHLLATLHRQPIDYFFADPEVEQPAGGFAPEAYFSDYTFNFERDGADLDALLARL